MASRKDYMEEAVAINELILPYMPSILLVEYLGRRADYYAEDNPRFNRDLFFKVCIRGSSAPSRKTMRDE